MRDFQQNDVYRWERKAIHPFAKTPVEYENIQSLVDHIWSTEGLEYPPVVQPRPRQVRKYIACANRTGLWFDPDGPTTTAVIIHEISHSLTMRADGMGSRHGALFVGCYCYLASKYCGMNLYGLWYSCDINNIKWEAYHTPVFLLVPELI